MSLETDRIINTVIDIPSPTGRAWHLDMLQQELEIRYSKSLGDTYTKRVLSESDKIIVIKSDASPFRVIGYEPKPVERAPLPPITTRPISKFTHNMWRAGCIFMMLTCAVLQACDPT